MSSSMIAGLILLGWLLLIVGAGIWENIDSRPKNEKKRVGGSSVMSKRQPHDVHQENSQHKKGKNDPRAVALKQYLLSIYDCGVEFTLSVSNRKPKTLLGCYYTEDHHIVIYAGWGNQDMYATALHEYAHHIVTTRIGANSDNCHDCNFWEVYSALIYRARLSGLYAPKLQFVVNEIRNE